MIFLSSLSVRVQTTKGTVCILQQVKLSFIASVKMHTMIMSFMFSESRIIYEQTIDFMVFITGVYINLTIFISCLDIMIYHDFLLFCFFCSRFLALCCKNKNSNHLSTYLKDFSNFRRLNYFVLLIVNTDDGCSRQIKYLFE